MASATTKNLSKYLQEHKCSEGDISTHTRIGRKDKDEVIFGGNYHIPDSEWANFMQMYYQHVIVGGNLEYLTEKQPIDNSPITLDFDFHYDKSVTTRQHTEEHIQDALMEYFPQIEKLLDIPDGTSIEVFVMEKKDVNVLPEKTKDGIHVIICLQMHRALQAILRTKMIPLLKNTWDDLPVKNEWSEVLDEGVTKGICNWQMYGSRKPGHQAYMMKYHYVFTYAAASEDQTSEWSLTSQSLKKFSTEKYINKLSVRYKEHPGFPIHENIYEAFEAAIKTLSKKEGSVAQSSKAGNSSSTSQKKKTSPINIHNYSNIKSEADLDKVLNAKYDNDSYDYRHKELLDYIMCLPNSFYGPGSYSKWRGVMCALHNESDSLFPEFLKFSCQSDCRGTLKDLSGKFDWGCVSEIYEEWSNLCNNYDKPLSARSIIYWARKFAPEKYKQVYGSTIDYYVSQSIKSGGGEFDLATVLYHMKKDKYVCTSIKNKIWYEYINHRWHEIDSGVTLRLVIPNEMHRIYFEKLASASNAVLQLDVADPKREEAMDMIKLMGKIATSLKRTQPKINIMTEACLQFYDKKFSESLDKNTHLLCFRNGVFDFHQKIFRNGQPEDCVSKCTNIDYIPYETVLKDHAPIVKEVETFMLQVFPVDDLREYMWDHLASTLIGVNKNQTFHVYIGSGANGKSILVALMQACLGTYAQEISALMLTSKPSDFGKATPELAKTPGVRYLAMGEPSKGAKLEEGTMKLFSGDDNIPIRKLFGDAETFKPQFKMVLLTNTDLEITANDDGTWRRIRDVTFVSKFTDKPYEDEQFGINEYPYQYKIDVNLKEKLPIWAPIFMSMLVKRVCQTDGFVKDCPTVLISSKKKRENNDYLAAFARDKILRKEGGQGIKKTALMEEFKNWYIRNFPGSKTLPKAKEIVDYMNLKYSECTKSGWRNVEMIMGDQDDED